MDRNVHVTEQSENIEAIEVYIGETQPKTPEAADIRDEFLRYTASLSTLERELSSGVYDTVRNYKLRFNRANAVTPAEKQAVEDQALRGMSSEQMRGEADRRLSNGEYAAPPSVMDQVKPLLFWGGAIYLLGMWISRKKS